MLSPMMTEARDPLEVPDPALRPRVLIADDHVPTRHAVRTVLEHEGFAVCAEVPNAWAATDAALTERPDICLLDIDMPGDGIETAKVLARRLPETAVVMLTVSSAERDLAASRSAGARGYVLKDQHPADLAASLHRVLRGEIVFPPGAGG
jgi:two-component system, NarL family, nitrate/nitrite response regulator NarL